MQLTEQEIVARRLANQQFGQTGFRKPGEIVRWFGAMQAQEYALTKWAIGLRLSHLKDVDVERDFAEGRLLRTHLLRSTWHFVVPDDIRWMLTLTAPHVQAGNAYMYRKTGLDARLFARSNRILTKILAGACLSRQQINEHFKKGKINLEGLPLSLVMMQAELEGIVCSGPRAGNQFTYALLEERVAPVPAILREEALATLTGRYFTSRGPASVADFTTWSGLSVKDARSGIDMMQSQLSVARIDGKDYYWSTGTSGMDEGSVSEAYLLPPYDEYIMGYKNRAAIMPDTSIRSEKPRLFFDNMILYKGRVAGTWRRSVQKKQLDLEYQLFKPGRELRKALSAVVKKFEAFSGLPAVLIER